MKKTIILSALFFVMMAAAAVGYRALTSDYGGNDFNGENAQRNEAADLIETEDAEEESGIGKDEITGDQEDGSGTGKDEVTEDQENGNGIGRDEITGDQEVGSGIGGKEETEGEKTEDEITEDGTAEEKAADFGVEDQDGSQVRLSDFYGKPIVVNFWATWCGPCKVELPAFDEAYAAHQDEVTFLMVNITDGFSETVEGTKQFVEENGYAFPVYFDTSLEAYRAYRVTAIPMTLFIDADGKLISSELGAMSESTLAGYLKEYFGVE